MTRTLPVNCAVLRAQPRDAHDPDRGAGGGVVVETFRPGATRTRRRLRTPAHLEIARDPRDARTVVVTRSVSFDLDRIPVARYGAWRAWVQKVDALMHKVVRLAKEQEQMSARTKTVAIAIALTLPTIQACGGGPAKSPTLGERRPAEQGGGGGAGRGHRGSRRSRGDAARCAGRGGRCRGRDPWRVAARRRRRSTRSDVARGEPRFEDAETDSALAYRVKDAGQIRGRTAKPRGRAPADDPFSAGLVARALLIRRRTKGT